ncbi:MAG: hypothetical protein IPI25_09580 [Candidatus Brocadia sp.]|nr:MAG: hypothetical protein IPI25_09580 [Candidatus Brocadia sp.]
MLCGFMLILVISWYYAGKIITITGKLCRTGVVKMITKEKSEAISYKLPPGVFREETAWMDFLRNRVFMNKSFMTNAIAAVVFGISYEIPGFFGRNAIMLASLFALSGALTNWLAVYMLFERIPGLYGSGIVTLRFDQFKQSIRSLIMENFFTKENFVKVTQNTLPHTIQPEMVLDKIDFDDVFSGLVAVIKKFIFRWYIYPVWRRKGQVFPCVNLLRRNLRERPLKFCEILTLPQFCRRKPILKPSGQKLAPWWILP